MATSSILREFTIRGEEDITTFLNAIEESMKDDKRTHKVSAKQIKSKKKLMKLFSGEKLKIN